MLNRYRDGEGNPKYRLSQEDADLLAKAKRIGRDKIDTIVEEESGLPFISSLPDGLSELAKPFQLDIPKVLHLSDIHLPFHNKRAVDGAIHLGMKYKVDAVFLNGDTLDMYQLSKFDKTHNKANIVDEIKLCRELFRVLREVFPKAEIYFKKGNHEERYVKYFASTAKEFYGFDDFLLEKIIHCDKYGIHTIEDKQLVMIGNLPAYHGHELGGSGENIGAALLKKTYTDIICGHWHTSQTVVRKRLNSEAITAYLVGCLCNLDPFYCPNNQWQNGAAVVETFQDKTFHVHNKRIINGQAI